MKQRDELIKEIIENFDFIKVHKVMIYLEWGWHDGEVPTIGKLVLRSKEMLKEAYDKSKKNHYFVETGGFKAEYNAPENYMQLSFILENFDSYDN